MAEAVVEDRPLPQRFYCHLCSVEVQSVNSDFTCPLCSGGFIEELPASTEPSSEDAEMLDENGELNLIRDEIATLLMSRTNNRPLEPDGTEEDFQQNGRGGRRNPLRIRMRNFNRFDNILLEILQTLSGGNEAALGNASMFFLGNPGDYAWGREGIDTIVTQLLNQMDTTGPPPLPKDKIDEIPNVGITQEQVDIKLQCSVCWEDFKLSESVRKLPCLHVYHENCIVPWLELHGTCPICRKSLTPELPDLTNNLRHPPFIHRLDDQGMYINENELPEAGNTTTVSSQEESQPSESGNNIFNAIPLSLSRIFSQPGTSSQAPSLTFSSVLGGNQQQQQMPDQQQQLQNQNDCDGGGGGGGGSRDSNDTQNRRNTNQSDVYKYDDGNVEFDFD